MGFGSGEETPVADPAWSRRSQAESPGGMSAFRPTRELEGHGHDGTRRALETVPPDHRFADP
jgi:hypothetical protein